MILKEGMNKTFIEEGCILSKQDLEKRLTQIRSSKDDLPSTEYFITNNQFTYQLDLFDNKPPVDMRNFSCEQ